MYIHRDIKYYSNKDVDFIKLIYDLLKNQGFTIEGAKKLLKNPSFKLDQNFTLGIKNKNFQTNLKNKEADPFKILGVKRTDNDNIIRKKWIKLSKEHHPDNLISQGMPKEFIDRANQELASINLAYDKIKDIRGIN